MSAALPLLEIRDLTVEFVTRRGIVPTREGSMHDLFNAMIWSAYPRAKRALHAHQDAAVAREITEGQTALPGRRSRMRDRLSMLDEGGVLVWCRDARPDVAFEIDDYTDDTAASVIVRGRARVLEGDEVYRAESLPLRPWVPTVKNVVVEIEPTELSGRRFRLDKPWTHLH